MEELVAGIVGQPHSLVSCKAFQGQELVKGLRGSAPAPFLTKTFKMVDDPETNNVISWSCCGSSLIILDHLKFAAEILPAYFKHSNLSSFLYQLNNYGFKKIGLRQYEYENKWFQAGQEHLLINIKRRSDQGSTRQRMTRRNSFAVERDEMGADMEKVTNNISYFKVEIPKLKRQLGHVESCIAAMQQNVGEIERKSKKMMVFLGRVFGSHFVEKITQRVEEEGELHGHEMRKRRRLVAPEGSENSSNPVDQVDKHEPDPSQAVKGKNQAEKSSSPDDSIPKKNGSEEYDPYKIWEKIVGEDSESANNESAQQHSRFHMALDDMMTANMIVIEVEGLNGKSLNVKHLDDEVTFELWA